MISFKEFILESDGQEIDTGTITAKELEKHIGKGAVKSIARHPYFQQYMTTYHPGVVRGYRYTKDKNGFEKVYAGTSHVMDTSHGKIRRMVQFDMKYKGRSVQNAHMYHNVDGKRHKEGNIFWEHISSHWTPKTPKR